MSVDVICGNSGDWEYARDAYRWAMWIERNITDTKFEIRCHGDADKCTIYFEDDGFDIIFKLKAPRYISFGDVT